MSIWEDLGKSHSSGGPRGTAPALRAGKEMLSLVLSFLYGTPSLPPLLLPSTAQLPSATRSTHSLLHPQTLPLQGVSARRKPSIPPPARRSHGAASPRSAATLRASPPAIAAPGTLRKTNTWGKRGACQEPVRKNNLDFHH